jgi:hypothetical protein
VSDLQSAYIALIELKKALGKLPEQDEDEDDDSEEDSESVSRSGPERPQKWLMLQIDSPLTHPVKSQPFASSNVTYEDLTNLKIIRSDIQFLVLEPNWEKRLSNATFRGKDELWSSANLYRHLAFLGSVDRRSPKVRY